jgi:hypothetical protein
MENLFLRGLYNSCRLYQQLNKDLQTKFLNSILMQKVHKDKR